MNCKQLTFLQQAIVCLFVAKAGYTSSARRRCLLSLEWVKHGLDILLNIRSLHNSGFYFFEFDQS